MHKRGFYSLLLIACTILTSSNLSAQELLNLEQCRELAIQNNKKLRIATEEERVAHYQKKEAFLQYLPKLSLTGTYIHNEKNLQLIPSTIDIPSIPGILPGGTTIPTPDKIRELGELDVKNIGLGILSLKQPIFVGGKIIAYNDIRKYAEEIARSKKEMHLQDVIAESDAAYWQVVSVAHKKRLAQSLVDLLTKMENDISAMESEGLATKADVLSVKVKLNEAEVTLTQAENGLSLSKMLLNQICGLELAHPTMLADEQQLNISPDLDLVEYPNVQEAIENRQEIKSLILATKIAKKKEQIARSEFMPQIALTANYLSTYPSAFNGMEKKFKGMWNVGLAMSMSLNVFSNSAKLNTAKAESVIQQLQMDEVKEKIELQINQSAYKLDEANKKMIATQKNVESAEENLRYASVGFEEGVISASDLMAAQTAWLSAQTNFLDAKIDLKLCKLYLDKALGKNLNVKY